MGLDSPQYITRECERCGNGIEFDANALTAGETRLVYCPHCSLATKLFVSDPTLIVPVAPTSRPAAATPIAPHVPAAPPAPAPKPVPPSVPKIASQPATKVARPASRLGIASMILGGAGLVICLLPFARIYSIPVSLAGSLVALAGAVRAIKTQKTGFGFLVGGAVTCLLSMIVAALILIYK
jgi:hypothetical protein